MQETSGQKTEIFCKELAKKHRLYRITFLPCPFA
ncbi:hypothetical protein L280_12625 [Mannheimia haemolytica MhBrain2012]|nr:hypothetical protein F382_03430 [Mannheimia haemolytica D153]AGQ38080.1 hypothetical protein J450_02630 [Mannheimia haemolytica D171]AGQ40632.1 hypothetical protein J451_03735 [Mannheimia haemolytica D174]AGR75520.1 hypothetical protein N220_09480 [Mannheimia haemolytica USMARC_2286]EPY99227.1 hypothetical protein L278_10870 [Mannheimia haemolytica D35]EPZ01814.1 hypothetical protein L279_11615 [Mannheimia haemolytica D38]EPZ24289.1 hypothetical protein L277_13230 [Mannheimia haemolytica D